MQTIQNTIVGTLESVKDRLEQRDEAIIKREKIFAPAAPAEKESESKPEKPSEEIVAVQPLQDKDFDQFKKVSLELMDIGMFYGQQGLEQIKHLPLYQRVDRVVQFDDKFDLVKTHGF